MNTRTQIAIVFLGLALALPAVAGDAAKGTAAPWFDMEKCAACAPYMAEPGLMENASMEYFSIATGMTSVCTAPAAYESALLRAHDKCNNVIMRAQGGEKLYLCGYCENLLSLAGAGAKIDDLRSKGGFILTATATDAALIQKLHAHVAKTQAEMKKMMESSQASK